ALLALDAPDRVLAPGPASGDAASAQRPSPGAEEPRSAPLRVPAYVAFGVGGAGVAIGAITGGVFVGKAGPLKARCPDARCPPDAQHDLDSTRALGNAATAGLVLGAAGLVTGAVLFFVRPPRPPPTQTVALKPWAGLGSAGVMGSF